jgi:hypothetical protein
MRNPSAPALLALVFVCTVTSFTATGPAIGSATANGSFLVDSSKIWRNTTLFEGSIVETITAPSDVRLNDGLQVRLAADSRARVYRSRIVLERGLSQLQAAVDTPLEARTLKIYSASAGSVAQLRLGDSNKVHVAAVKGSLRVTNASGVLVANLAAPAALAFDTQAGPAASARISGCLLTKDGKFIVADRTTRVTMEVYGAGLEKQVGNQVELTGTADAETPSVAGASQRINVTAIKLIAKGGCASVAKKLGAGAAAAGAGGVAAAGTVAAGLSTVATVAIVGGVAVVGSTAGLAASGTFSGDEERPSVSR